LSVVIVKKKHLTDNNKLMININYMCIFNTYYLNYINFRSTLEFKLMRTKQCIKFLFAMNIMNRLLNDINNIILVLHNIEINLLIQLINRY